MSSPGIVPRFRLADVDVPEPEEADGPITRWETNDGVILVGYRVGGMGWLVIPGVAAFGLEKVGDVVTRATGGSEQAISDAWVRSVLPLVVQERGTQVLHASAVVGPSGVTAFCGRSTAGKSTVAEALRQEGHRVVADDAIAFVVEDGGAHALTLPFRLRLRPASAAHLSSPSLAAEGDGGERFQLQAIVLLEPDATGARQPRCDLVPPSEAIGALMPHAYCFSLEQGKEELVRAYATLTASVAIRRLSFPRELEVLADVVDEVEALLGG